MTTPRTTPALVAAVAVGGAVGGLARHLVAEAWPTAGGSFPWGTFVVNVLGALALGALTAAVLARPDGRRHWYPLLGTGLCGALTTMSTFAVELADLVRDGHALLAAVYAAASVAAGLVAAGAAWSVVGRLVPHRVAGP